MAVSTERSLTGFNILHQLVRDALSLKVSKELSPSHSSQVRCNSLEHSILSIIRRTSQSL